MSTTTLPPPSESPLTPRERKRRVLLLALAFTRNMAFYRAGWSAGKYTGPKTQFWITANGNFIDAATLEWWKLFCDKRGKHHWRKVVANPAKFETDLLAHIDITAAEFDALINEVSTYRDKFVAHLDDKRTLVPPRLDRLWAAVQFLFRHVLKVEMTQAEADEVRDGLLASNLPTDIGDYQKERLAEGKSEYTQRKL
jgi:hypothetical protein